MMLDELKGLILGCIGASIFVLTVVGVFGLCWRLFKLAAGIGD